MTDRAATEPIAVILLVGVVVVASVTLGGSLLTQAGAIVDRSDTTNLNIKTEMTESDVTVRHVGGPEFETANVRFLLVGDTDRVGPHTLDEPEVSGSGLDDGIFGVGDEATLNHPFTGYIEVSLFDTESGDRLYRTLRSPLSEPEGPTAVANSLDRVAEGYSITLDGSDSFPDSSIESYSWEITSGVGSITGNDPVTPNATYRAPADVDGDQTVEIELTVTDDNGLTDTATTTVTVVDIDTAEPPTDESGDGAAFDDTNGNGLYDGDDEVISKEDLEAGFNDQTVDLVIYPEVGEVRTTGDPVDITANTITAGSDFTSSGDAVRLTATGDIRIDGATLDARSNSGISITSTDGRIFANETTMTARNGPIELNSNGDIYLESADLDAGSYTADLTTTEATLYVDQLSLGGGGGQGGGGGGTLEYYPNDIAVVGTPSQGTASPGA